MTGVVMNKLEIRQNAIAAAKVSQGNRAARLLRNPKAVLVPYLMRKLNLKRDVEIKTSWGGNFNGILPESVTSEIWRSGGFELPVCLSLIRFLDHGSTFIDIGAHFGYFSLLASELVGQAGSVVSIEAMPSTFTYLQNNISRNSAFENVSLFQGAAYSERTELEFRDFGVVASSLNSAFAARDSSGIINTDGEIVKVQAHKVDDIVSMLNVSKIDTIKIDAESSERFVIRGLSETIKKHSPKIILEVGDSNPGEGSVAELLQMMAAHGYVPYYWKTPDELVRYTPTDFVPYANLTFSNSEP
jgi:FkbM family methyltransferase